MMNTNRFFILILVLVVPAITHAGVLITEIMYDAPGSDTGHEWVEISNQSNGAIDLSTYYFFENNTFHSVRDCGFVDVGESAIIADDPTKFATDNPSFSGSVCDSSFSLSNSGESIAIADQDKNILNTISYDVNLGAAGDGHSLQFNGASWFAGVPTIGIYSGSPPANTNIINTDTTSTSQFTDTSAPLLPYTVLLDTAANTVAGADIFFSANVLDEDGKKITANRYVWSFGDGQSQTGVTVLHSYPVPGIYTVYVDAVLGEVSMSAHKTLTVTVPNITITTFSSATTPYIAIKNDSSNDLDLSFWGITAGSKAFYLPKHSIITAHKEMYVTFSTLGMTPTEYVTLLFPSGRVAVESDRPSLQVFSAVRPESFIEQSVAARAQNVVNTSSQSDVQETKDSGQEAPYSASQANIGTAISQSTIGFKWYIVYMVLAGGVIGVLYLIPTKKEEDLAAEYNIEEDI